MIDILCILGGLVVVALLARRVDGLEERRISLLADPSLLGMIRI